MTPRILIVEDEAITAMDIKRILGNLGFEVVSTASRGDEAIQKAEDLKPDLVIMDILLKGEMNGIEAARKIQTLLDIPVIYLTAYSDEKTLKKVESTKPYGFISKPVKHDVLEESIVSALNKHELDKN
jgi:DNA-binding NarL/FixJ family response regulator